MTDYAALTRTLNTYMSWRAIADFMAVCGTSRTAAHWNKISHGQFKRIGRPERMAICRAFVLPDPQETPLETVAHNAIQYVMVGDDPAPDTALLVRSDGLSFSKVVCKRTNTPISQAVKTPQVLVTDGYIAVRGRKRKRAIVDLSQTVRGSTGNFSAISNAARLAAKELANERT